MFYSTVSAEANRLRQLPGDDPKPGSLRSRFAGNKPNRLRQLPGDDPQPGSLRSRFAGAEANRLRKLPGDDPKLPGDDPKLPGDDPKPGSLRRRFAGAEANRQRQLPGDDPKPGSLRSRFAGNKLMSKSLLAAFALVAAFALPASAAEPKLTRYSFTQPHMGTLFKIIVYAADEATARKAAEAAFARVAELDGIMSDYKPASELMRLCAKAGGDPVKVSDDLWTVLERAQEVAKRSDGAFDITVGPVVRLWRRAARRCRCPTPRTWPGPGCWSATTR